MSSGAIAGIVIGALIGAALIVALALFIYMCDYNRRTVYACATGIPAVNIGSSDHTKRAHSRPNTTQRTSE